MTQQLWFEKYRPQNLDDTVLSPSKRTAIVNWFTRYRDQLASNNTGVAHSILLLGPPGLGKTTVAHAVLRQFGYRIKEFNASDIRSKSLIEENLSTLTQFTPVSRLFSREVAPLGIIMDEVDGMFKGDRGGMEVLLSYLRPERACHVPIICICNVGNIKRDTLNTLKKECFTVDFTLSEPGQLEAAAQRILAQEHFQLAPEALNLVIRYSQQDYRRLVCLLEFLYYSMPPEFRDDTVTESTVCTLFDQLLCRKEQDLYITDSVRALLNQRLSPPDIQTIYNSDKSKAPMVVHQNYPRAVALQTQLPAAHKLNIGYTILRSLTVADSLERMMYNTQNWSLQPIQAAACAHIPNYWMTRYPKTLAIEANWAMVLSVNSQAQNQRKNLYAEAFRMTGDSEGDLPEANVQTVIGGYTVESYRHILETVIVHLMGGNYRLACKLLLTYNIGQIRTEVTKKRAVLAIDRMTKYLKLSPVYEAWGKWKNLYKGDLALDGVLKGFLRDPALACQPEAPIIKIKVKLRADTGSELPPAMMSSRQSGIPAQSSASQSVPEQSSGKIKIKLKAK